MNSKQSDRDGLAEASETAKRARRSSLTFSPLVVVVAALFVTGVVAGLIPRFRQQSELGASTVELSTPTVSVVSPKPGQPASLIALPAEIKPWSEAPIYARQRVPQEKTRGHR